MVLFNIERNSYVDGPGIRTTVFFKGCNLNCLWCHNPEGKSPDRQMLFFPDLCTGCGKCLEKCPNQAIRQPSRCSFCGECELYCPHGARKICGKEVTVAQVMEEIRKDRAFYEKSGGGVTISGGECMLCPDDLYSLLSCCKKEGLHTAVDTAGCVPFSSFEKILDVTDLFLYDIKAITPGLHKRLTGADNRLILENLVKLFERKKEIIIRIPVIGGANDSPEEMAKIAAFLKDYKPVAIELLPYHTMGENKYRALGQEAEHFHTPDMAEMTRLRRLFTANQCPCR